MCFFIDPPANRLDTFSLKLQTFYTLPSLIKYHILRRHWRAGSTINKPRLLGFKKLVLYLKVYLWKGLDAKITNSSIVVLTLISPHYRKFHRTCFQKLSLTTLTIRSLLLILEKTDNLLSSKNCLKPNTLLLDLKSLNSEMLYSTTSEIPLKFPMN